MADDEISEEVAGDAGAMDSSGAPGPSSDAPLCGERDAYGNPPVVLSEWAKDEMRRQGLVPYDIRATDDLSLLTGYFCTASGCFEDRHDSHGECINCGEPVVLAMTEPGRQSGRSGEQAT